MAPRTMSAEDWLHVFPQWPKPSRSGINASDLVATRYVDVLTVVVTHERWEQEPQLPIDTEADVRGKVGRWLLTDFAIECPAYAYQIAYDRLDEPDWFAHMLEKIWLYDPTDFLDAYEAARQISRPDEPAAARAAATERQLTERPSRLPLVFGPSRLTGGHLYLPSRMREHERVAFAAWLADQGYYANHG